METLTQIQLPRLRNAVRLNVVASFVRATEPLPRDARLVPPIHVTVHYDGEPFIRLVWENFSVVTAEYSSDLTRLFCVTAFATLQAPEAMNSQWTAQHGVAGMPEATVASCR